VLQRCLDHADPTNRDRIIAEVVRNAAQLVVNPFGNYVVQYILDLKQPPLTRSVVHALRGGFAELSLQKFSSNVIEKCLKSGDQVRRWGLGEMTRARRRAWEGGWRGDRRRRRRRGVGAGAEVTSRGLSNPSRFA
jgi:hypothetical protein